jgi:hypothetical protein
MEQDKLQLQRFELKYIVSEDVALSVRDFVKGYLEIDEYGALRPDLSYPVHSLYLDSADMSIYQRTINGDKNRYKLRVRYYDDRPSAPVFFEIKRRMNNIILKQRCGVKREGLDWVLAGHLPDASQLISKDPRQVFAIQNFINLMMQDHARPKAHIFYMREAWISRHDNSVRVTMDRNVLCEQDFTSGLQVKTTNPVVVFGKEVILELKFTNRFPDWFGHLVQVFHLMQCGAAKYVDGVTLLGERIPCGDRQIYADHLSDAARGARERSRGSSGAILSLL